MISVLLPTVRPHLLESAFASIEPAANGAPYEVVVIADFPEAFVHAKLQWVERARLGVVDALNAGMGVARGEYIFSFNDESQLDASALESLFVEAETQPRRILTPKHLPPFNFSYYGKMFAPFPFVHRDVLAKIGGIADPVFRAFYADPDLSLRAYACGVPVEILDKAIIRHANNHDVAHQRNVNAYLEADREVFKKRWAHLGEFCDP